MPPADDPQAPPVSRRQPSALPLYLIAGATFGALAVRGLLIPLQAAAAGADRFQVGLLFSAATFTGAILSLPAGHLADRFGRRPLLLLSVGVGALSQLAAAATDNFGILLLSQALTGMGAGVGQAVIQTSLADFVPAQRIGRAMGWLTLAMQTGFLAGPAIAGFGLQFLSIHADLALTTIILLPALPLAVIATSGSRSRGAGSSPPIRQALAELSRQRGFYALVIALFAATLLWGTVQGFLPVFGKQHLGLPLSQIGYLVALQAVANGLARIPGGRLVDRVKRRGPLVIAGLAIYAVAVAVLPHLTGFWAPALLLGLTVPALATAFIAISVAWVDISSPSSRGVAMGLYGSVLYFGLGFGTLVMGVVMDRQGYTVGFTVTAIAGMALAGLTALARTEAFQRRRPLAIVPPPGP
jgi:MFS family permease